MSRKCLGEISGASGISLKKRPVRTGESTSVSSGTVSNWVVVPSVPVLASAVPSFQPSGNLTEGANLISPAGVPAGYNATSFQETTARLGLVDAPAEKPLGAAVARKSTLASSTVTPAGILRWNANIFTGSRSH